MKYGRRATKYAVAVLSGRFNWTQSGWSVFRKEAYSIISSCDHISWLLENLAGFDLYIDHSNLVFIFNPIRYLPGLSASLVRKVLQRAVAISWYNYVCYHISGMDNVRADLIGRWTPCVRCLISLAANLSQRWTTYSAPSHDSLAHEINEVHYCKIEWDNS